MSNQPNPPPLSPRSLNTAHSSRLTPPDSSAPQSWAGPSNEDLHAASIEPPKKGKMTAKDYDTNTQNGVCVPPYALSALVLGIYSSFAQLFPIELNSNHPAPTVRLYGVGLSDVVLKCGDLALRHDLALGQIYEILVAVMSVPFSSLPQPLGFPPQRRSSGSSAKSSRQKIKTTAPVLLAGYAPPQAIKLSTFWAVLYLASLMISYPLRSAGIDPYFRRTQHGLSTSLKICVSAVRFGLTNSRISGISVGSSSDNSNPVRNPK
ncbi:hypothetical protein B0H13DRAFT_1871013 [Mycena leptocephala]|nr:hypothetical protein B0H13DRAFT_1871013 [Mycena leptocephala]